MTDEALPLECAAAAQKLSIPLAGSAPQAIGWVVIEVDGAWAALTPDNLPPQLADALNTHIGSSPIRLQLLRTPGAHPRTRGACRVLLAHSGPTPWMVALDAVSHDKLATLPVAATLEASVPDLGEPVDSAALFVCTHGTRDRCCARLGRPVVSALLPEHPLVFETSHVGGHRFAGNVLQLPQGLLYGGVGVDDARGLAQAALNDRVVVERLRGRTTLSPAAQAAEIFARQQLGIDSHATDVTVTAAGAQFAVRIGETSAHVTVTADVTAVPAPLSCGGVPETSTIYRPAAVEPVG